MISIFFTSGARSATPTYGQVGDRDWTRPNPAHDSSTMCKVFPVPGGGTRMKSTHLPDDIAAFIFSHSTGVCDTTSSICL